MIWLSRNGMQGQDGILTGQPLVLADVFALLLVRRRAQAEHLGVFASARARVLHRRFSVCMPIFREPARLFIPPCFNQIDDSERPSSQERRTERAFSGTHYVFLHWRWGRNIRVLYDHGFCGQIHCKDDAVLFLHLPADNPNQLPIAHYPWSPRRSTYPSQLSN